MSEAGIQQYFATARERYQILLNRRAGKPKPWTTDPVFLNHRFCNVRREDDRTTIWFRENIRDPLNKISYLSPGVILLAIVAFRWFNKIETWDSILSSGVELEMIFAKWNSKWIKQEIEDHCKAPYITGAYIIKTPNGKTKVDGILWCIDEFKKLLDNGKFDLITHGTASLERATSLLEASPFLGKFMAYQIVADARFTRLLNCAPDIFTWAQPGPGSTRGIGRVFYNDVNKFTYGSLKDEKIIIEHMYQLLERSRSVEYWPSHAPILELQDIQNFCCEHDKYLRCLEGGRMKRKYNAS